MNNMAISSGYDRFTDMMQYYNYAYFAYYILIFIMGVITLKSYLKYRKIKKKPEALITVHIVDIIISIIIGAGFSSMMMFLGTMADIATEYFRIWGNKGWALLAIYVILFITNWILTGKITKLKLDKARELKTE